MANSESGMLNGESGMLNGESEIGDPLTEPAAQVVDGSAPRWRAGL
jgi:hypothetical protein